LTLVRRASKHLRQARRPKSPCVSKRCVCSSPEPIIPRMTTGKRSAGFEEPIWGT
jgi:hypothetical protein